MIDNYIQILACEIGGRRTTIKLHPAMLALCAFVFGMLVVRWAGN